MQSTNTYDVIVIGAGAAGLMAAIEAGKRGRRVLVLEHNDKVGKKIRISGGGRCNFTNRTAGPDNYLSENPHFARSALARYTPQDFCGLVERYKIAYHEKTLGQLFCDASSQQIIDLLTKECRANNVQIVTSAQIKEVSKADIFYVATSQGKFRSTSLVIATGGLSIAPLGATDFGYQVAGQFGITVNPCRPGLVPLLFQNRNLNLFKELAGVSLTATVKIDGISFREKILFTHKGLSGPAILQISSYWKDGKPIVIDLLPQVDIQKIFKSKMKHKTAMKNFLKDYLPSRLADILSGHFFANKPLNQYSPKEFADIAKFLHNWQIIPHGTEGYAKAEVTVGGVDTDELSSKTMESKKVPGLYFVGEVVDVTGWLGGYNFQWAWASGFAAGQYA